MGASIWCRTLAFAATVAVAVAQSLGGRGLSELSWSASLYVNCSSDFPMCPGTPFTQLTAQSATGFKQRQGPISLLPQDENQILVYRFDLGYEYLLNVDATAAPPKVLNCTRAPLKVPHNKTAWERGFFGELDNAATAGPAPCAPAAPGCEMWKYDTAFNIGCLGTDYTGHEEQAWQLSPLAVGQAVFLQGFSNLISYPAAAPKDCRPATSVKWYVDSWSEVSTAPDDSLFDVPSDCAEVTALAGYRGGRGLMRGPGML